MAVHERKPAPVIDRLKESRTGDTHPSGPARHGPVAELLRIVLFGVYFFGCCSFLHVTQWIGIPLYWIDRDQYYAWMALTKQYFGLLVTTMTQWWSPTKIILSGDASMDGQLEETICGRVYSKFPERMVLLANHQIYTDWLYLWWIAYTADMHGHIYIILKQSLKWVPLIGWGMQLFSFIFMARKWASDQSRIRYRLQKLKIDHTDDKGLHYYNPMWLLIFPEGTNLSKNGRASSKKWAEKSGQQDMRHLVLPRSRGLQLCLSELADSVEYIYDCTIGYENIPEGQYGQDIYTLRSVYFQGRPPKSVSMHWRRYRISDVPVHDEKGMEQWVLARWREKDDLLEAYKHTGRFPADARALTLDKKLGAGTAYIETEVRPRGRFEFLKIFVPLLALVLLFNLAIKMLNFAHTGRFDGQPR